MSHENRLQFLRLRIAGLKCEHVGLSQIETTRIGLAGVKHCPAETTVEIDQASRVISGMCLEKLVLREIQARFTWFGLTQWTLQENYSASPDCPGWRPFRHCLATHS